jgi:phosphatidylserine decarboxylase
VERDRAKHITTESKRRPGETNGRSKLIAPQVSMFLAWVAADRAKGKKPDWRWYATFFEVSARQLQRIEASKSWKQ